MPRDESARLSSGTEQLLGMVTCIRLTSSSCSTVRGWRASALGIAFAFAAPA